MTKKKLWAWLVSAFIGLSAQATGITITGTTADKSISKLFLFTVYDEQYGYVQLIDSVVIENGSFTYHNDSLRSQVLFFTPYYNPKDNKTISSGSYHFLAGGQNNVVLQKDAKGKLKVDVQDGILDKKYQTYLADKHAIGNRQILDSLDILFFAARDRGDKAEMRRIKDYSEPYYNDGVEKVETFLLQQLKANKGTAFGAYLYYTNVFRTMTLKTTDDVANIRKELEQYDNEGKQTDYYNKMEQKLSVMQKSVVGQVAPKIVGTNMQGKPISLADFKGKYVLVDFWSAGCSWCRKETPNLKKTYAAFKDKGFTILGVSTDFKKSDWLQAIREDKAIWHHLLLSRSDRDATLKRYSIIGIPQMILIDPQGNIVAKDLRGEEIYETVKQYIK